MVGDTPLGRFAEVAPQVILTTAQQQAQVDFRRRELRCGYDRTVYRHRNVVERCFRHPPRRGATRPRPVRTVSALAVHPLGEALVAGAS